MLVQPTDGDISIIILFIHYTFSHKKFICVIEDKLYLKVCFF